MSESLFQSSHQSPTLSNRVLETIQIEDMAGRNLILAQLPDRVGAVTVFSKIQVAQAPLNAATSLSREEYEWRRILLSKVKQCWIDGVLAQSLHAQVLIDLGLEDQLDPVVSLLNEGENFTSSVQHSLPAAAAATDLFEDIGTGRTLLILGESGVGKTTTLLKLADSLIARAENDLSQPLPVVMQLSSWAQHRLSIDEWLVQELDEIYQVSKSLGRAWIDQEQFILLLDGLDEVKPQYRDACVHQLNQFIQAYSRTEVVVCSRIHDYEALSEQLSLRSTIQVQPLTSQQINQYLEQLGESLEALKTAINHNPNIQTLASSPLILSMLSLTYRGCSLDEIPQPGPANTFLESLFDAFIEQMLMRQRPHQNYTQERTKRWLIWMAHRMVQTSRPIFLIDSMQPHWLQTKLQRVLYRLENLLIGGLSIGLAFGLSIGLFFGLVAGRVSGLRGGLYIGGIYGLYIGLGSGVIYGLVMVFPSDILTVKKLKWSWEKAEKSLHKALILGLCIGLFFGMVVDKASVVLIFGLSVGLIVELIHGFRSPEIQPKCEPNQKIWQSSYRSLISGLRIGLIVMLIFGLIWGLFSGVFAMLGYPLSAWSHWLITVLLSGAVLGLISGVIFGLIYGLREGGSTCLRHFTLRLMLYRMGYIPWNYARFLDNAAERLLLQKIGGGYMFIHRLMLEHFAAKPLS